MKTNNNAFKQEPSAAGWRSFCKRKGFYNSYRKNWSGVHCIGKTHFASTLNYDT